MTMTPEEALAAAEAAVAEVRRCYGRLDPMQRHRLRSQLEVFLGQADGERGRELADAVQVGARVRIPIKHLGRWAEGIVERRRGGHVWVREPGVVTWRAPMKDVVVVEPAPQAAPSASASSKRVGR